MAKISARGCFELLRMVRDEYRELNEYSTERVLERTIIVFRSDGRILRQWKYKDRYGWNGGGYKVWKKNVDRDGKVKPFNSTRLMHLEEVFMGKGFVTRGQTYQYSQF